MQSCSALATLLGSTAAMNWDVATDSSAEFQRDALRAVVDAAGGVTALGSDEPPYDSYDYAATTAYEYLYDSSLGASEDSSYADGYDYSFVFDASPTGSVDYSYADAYDYLYDSGLGAASNEEPKWDYKSFHIGNWAEIGFPDCAGRPDGSAPHNEWQSPIDLPKNINDTIAESPVFTALQGGCTDMELVHNEHTFEADFFTSHNCENLQVTWKGTVYTMHQFHFHSESENLINREHFPGEMHMVHVSKNQSGHQSFLVVGVFLERVNGEGNQFLTRLFDQGFRNATNSEGIPVNPYEGVIKNNSKFLSYLGSFTTPPCTANVEWLSILDPIPINPTDLGSFKQYLEADADQVNSYYQNFRPAQPVKGRKFKVGNMIHNFAGKKSPSEMTVSLPGPLDE